MAVSARHAPPAVGSRRARAARPVPRGPVAYRQAIRRKGPWLSLTVPGVLGLAAFVVWSASVTWWAFAALALPTAVLAGLPLYAGPLTIGAAVATSLVVWILLGRWAAARATQSPVAIWRDWWREFATMTAAMWSGVGAGLITMTVVLTR